MNTVVDPAWFQAAIQPLQNEVQQLSRDIRGGIMPDLKRLMNESRGDGTVVVFDIVPFTDGSDPTQPPNNLPPLHSVNAIENLNGLQIAAYFNGYGIVPPVGANTVATNCLQKDTLKQLVGACP
ncbi:hypothetical protein K443DRAFT_8429 [Laccaria amethystina LaAM-08-1]|uniref:Mug135-like C-terminal domain-containing protein n=1 Tax=Laccaria amethystina LaAM-08-1 TaxID=1095629 RepID=A0A0C9WNT7_9AGAR|nr:hypothetical protein K443DRAFT_8429 [Laccaria amethystina LaAM-08-1]